MSRIGSFKAGIDRFNKKNEAKINRNVRKVVLACLGGVIRRSPVDTGFFRLNWALSVNGPDMTIGDKGGVTQPMPTFENKDVIYISNAMPYANRLESGWSKQAPGGVVAPTIRDVEAKIAGGALD